MRTLDENGHTSPTGIEGRLQRLERQNRVLRLGAILLAVVVLGVGTAAFGSSASPENVTARAVVLVDSTGAPAARISWEAGAIRFVTPVEAPEVGEYTGEMPGSDRKIRVVPMARPHGAQLILRPGESGPGLFLADRAGRVYVRLSSPRVGPAND